MTPYRLVGMMPSAPGEIWTQARRNDVDEHVDPRPRPNRRLGLTIPLDGVELPEQRELLRHAVAAGFTDLWSSETNGTDGLTPLALASAWEPAARLGSAILPVHTRGPA